MTRAPALGERIRRDIEACIFSGEWSPGMRIPFEHELMARYSCSRMTVSKALSALADAGLVERRKRAGTFVARPTSHAMILDIPDLAVEVRGRGAAYRFDPIARVIRAADPSDPGEMAMGGMLLAIDGLHCADGKPFAIEHRLIALAVVPEAADADFAGNSPGGWLLGHVPWTEAETRFAAVNADPVTADLLDIAPGAACLQVERRTWRAAEHITHVRQTFAPGGHAFVARFGHRHAG